MSRFEDRLWSELAFEYGPELARQTRTVELPRRRVSRRAPAVAVAVAAVAALVAVLLTSTGSGPSTTAYAVTEGPGGVVNISIGELTGIEGANEQLESLGVRVRVAEVQAGCSQSGQIVRISSALAFELVTNGQQGVTVQPRLVPRGDTLVLSAKQVGEAIGLSYALYRDPPPTCVGVGESHAG
jgi:hypothetical protein